MCTFVNPMWDLSNIFAIATSRIYTLNIENSQDRKDFSLSVSLMAVNKLACIFGFDCINSFHATGLF